MTRTRIFTPDKIGIFTTSVVVCVEIIWPTALVPRLARMNGTTATNLFSGVERHTTTHLT